MASITNATYRPRTEDRPPFREFSVRVADDEVERHAGVGMTAEAVVAFQVESLRDVSDPDGPYCADNPDFVICEGAKVVALVRPLRGGGPPEVLRFAPGEPSATTTAGDGPPA